jgi:hypothetical protein
VAQAIGMSRGGSDAEGDDRDGRGDKVDHEHPSQSRGHRYHRADQADPLPDGCPPVRPCAGATRRARAELRADDQAELREGAPPPSDDGGLL